MHNSQYSQGLAARAAAPATFGFLIVFFKLILIQI